MPSEYADRIDSITEAFKDEFGDMSTEELNWKPDGRTWSIAQVVDHLIVINESYYPIFDQVIDGTFKAPFHARIGFIVKFFGRTILHSVDPANRRKAKTFPIWEPAKSDLPGDIISLFASHQEKLKTYLDKLRPHIERGTVIYSPANKSIVYKLETAIEIIITHEERHIEQARELKPLAKEVDHENS